MVLKLRTSAQYLFSYCTYVLLSVRFVRQIVDVIVKEKYGTREKYNKLSTHSKFPFSQICMLEGRCMGGVVVDRERIILGDRPGLAGGLQMFLHFQNS